MNSRKNNEISRRDMLKLGAAGAVAAAGGVLAPGAARARDAEGTEEALPQVPRRTLGKTGKTVPILLVGAAVKLDNRFDPKLAEAVRFGANYFDAADCYGGGSCETAVGNYCARAENRDQIWITSKSDKHDPEGFETTLATSLEKLQTDYVDMYYLHALKEAEYLNDELKQTVDRLKKEGKILHFGFSCHDGNVVELLHKAAETPWVESVMFRYNFREYGDEKLNAAIDACVEANVGLIAMKTQGSEASFTAAWEKFEQSGRWNKHQAVLKAVWADERITAAVSHMDTFEKLRQNIGAALDKEDLGMADWDALENYARATRSEACSGCDHLCGPAVNAPVRIGDTMRFLMYHDVYGETAKAQRLFRGLPRGARKLSGVDFAGANAACPHGLDVAALMARAAEVFRA